MTKFHVIKKEETNALKDLVFVEIANLLNAGTKICSDLAYRLHLINV